MRLTEGRQGLQRRPMQILLHYGPEGDGRKAWNARCIRGGCRQSLPRHLFFNGEAADHAAGMGFSAQGTGAAAGTMPAHMRKNMCAGNWERR